MHGTLAGPAARVAANSFRNPALSAEPSRYWSMGSFLAAGKLNERARGVAEKDRLARESIEFLDDIFPTSNVGSS
jgi:hypothetical protein